MTLAFGFGGASPLAFAFGYGGASPRGFAFGFGVAERAAARTWTSVIREDH